MANPGQFHVSNFQVRILAEGSYVRPVSHIFVQSTSLFEDYPHGNYLPEAVLCRTVYAGYVPHTSAMVLCINNICEQQV